MVPQPAARDRSRIRTEVRELHSDVPLIPLHPRIDRRECLIVTGEINKSRSQYDHRNKHAPQLPNIT